MNGLSFLLRLTQQIPPLLSLPKLARFSSSSSSSSKPNPRPSSNFHSVDPDHHHHHHHHEGSLVYRHKLQFQRPPTITLLPWQDFNARSSLKNSASFIGSVLYPPRAGKYRDLSVHTQLQVKSSANCGNSFRILVVMREKLAEISLKYLREHDFVYVSGKFDSYNKIDENGHIKIHYKVNVNELNYVASNCTSDNSKISDVNERAVSTSGAPDMEKNTDRLYLWQVFFASPHEWWDNRKKKMSLRTPDFRHKDTGECLWLSSDDPPWVGRQLRLHDSRMADQGYRNLGNIRSRASVWKYDE